MKRVKQKPEPKQVTAQPVGDAFIVNGRGAEHMRSKAGGGEELVSDNRLSSGSGCYRRMPTCHD